MCYYSGPRDSVYERLGHAEVVQLQLDPQKQHAELEKFADVRTCPTRCIATHARYPAHHLA